MGRGRGKDSVDFGCAALGMMAPFAIAVIADAVVVGIRSRSQLP